MPEKTVGDGTGMGSMPKTSEGLSHVDGDEPQKMSGTTKAGSSMHPHHDGPQRTSHPHGDKGGGGSD